MRHVAAVVGLCCSLVACGGSNKDRDGSAYPDSIDGLAELVRNLVASARTENAEKLAEQARALRLTDHRAWFADHFGDELGKKLATDYAAVAGELRQLVRALETLSSSGHTKVVVERFDQPNQPGAIVYQDLALKKMKKRVPLYSVRLLKPGDSRGFHVWSFVYVDSGFRWAGKMIGVADTASQGPHDKNELRLRELSQASAP